MRVIGLRDDGAIAVLIAGKVIVLRHGCCSPPSEEPEAFALGGWQEPTSVSPAFQASLQTMLDRAKLRPLALFKLEWDEATCARDTGGHFGVGAKGGAVAIAPDGTVLRDKGVRPRSAEAEPTGPVRDDLKASFADSLRDAHAMSRTEIQSDPSRTAVVIVEGSLEDPGVAKGLFDKASDAYNTMRETTTAEARAKATAIRDFRAAMARETDRAKTVAPQRWARVVDALK